MNNEWIEITAKSVDEAVTEAIVKLETTTDRIEYEVIEKETNGILGLFAKPAKIRVRLKETSVEEAAETFLRDVLAAMQITATYDISYNEAESSLDIDIEGEDMGILIGKRGQTLDSLQYMVSLVVNKESEEYIKVKVDTENYRARRKETLENLAKNISSKVRRTRRAVILEPMNSFERRIIHSALQGDPYVETHSEGDEPYRKVVVTPKKDAPSDDRKKNYNGRGRNGRRNNRGGDRKNNTSGEE